MSPFQQVMSRVGRWACSLGLHVEPYQKEPVPRGMTPEVYELRPLYRCRRCGRVGRLDGHGNLTAPDRDTSADAVD